MSENIHNYAINAQLSMAAYANFGNLSNENITDLLTALTNVNVGMSISHTQIKGVRALLEDEL